ncbi:MAG: hypothetical protein WCP57_12555 [Bacteroidota bacterium]
MQYINPLEILGLSNATDSSSIDNEIVKKAKRKLFADIDLSDNGLFEYYGLQLTKGDCEKVIDELSKKELQDFYSYLLSNKKLNIFLVNGDVELFTNFQQDSIFKLPEFVNFLSPYFAPKFDKALLSAFENDRTDHTRAILNTSNLIAQQDLNLAFKSVSNNIQNKIAEIDEITKDIKNEESTYDDDDIEDVVQLVKEHFPTNTLNCLPQYFQSQILKIANSINYLSNSIWDAFDTTQVPNDLTEYLLTLNIGGLDRPTFENNFKIINKKNNERIEQAKNAPLLKKWATVLLELRKFIKDVEAKRLSSKSAFEKTKKLFFISELNSLPGFADDIRTQIGYSIRSLAIAIWNEYNDINNAINTINLTLQINVKSDDKEKFRQDLVDLQKLEKKYKGIFICHFCEKNTPDAKSKFDKTLYMITNRFSYGRARSVQYSTSTIVIPRCAECMLHHSEGKIAFYLCFWGLPVLVGVIGAIIDRENTYLACLTFLAIGYWVGKAIEYFIYYKNKIKSASNLSLAKHPLLKDKIKLGWSFSKPSAY